MFFKGLWTRSSRETLVEAERGLLVGMEGVSVRDVPIFEQSGTSSCDPSTPSSPTTSVTDFLAAAAGQKKIPRSPRSGSHGASGVGGEEQRPKDAAAAEDIILEERSNGSSKEPPASSVAGGTTSTSASGTTSTCAASDTSGSAINGSTSASAGTSNSNSTGETTAIGERRFIHTIDVEIPSSREGEEKDRNIPLVIWPGFGMGAAGFALTFPFFREMLPGLRGPGAPDEAKKGNEVKKPIDEEKQSIPRNFAPAAPGISSLHAVDWLGFGLSSRPPWPVKAGDENPVEKAENFFVEALESWREENKIEKMYLMGHSMGGYLSVAYCAKYPHRVEHLILASACGLARSPADEVVEARFSDRPWRQRALMNTVSWLWKKGATPQAAVRLLGYE